MSVIPSSGITNGISESLVINKENVLLENNPPYKPSNPFPWDGAEGVPNRVNLTWTGGDPDGDDVFYDVYFDDVNPPAEKVASKIDHEYWEIPYYLSYCETYYWRIDAYDSEGLFTEGQVWSFTISCYPPSDPIIDGPATGKKNQVYNFTFRSADPYYSIIKYRVKWGDGTEETTDFYLWFEPAILNHSWDTVGSKEIQAKAINEYGKESYWSTWTIAISRNKPFDFNINPFNQQSTTLGAADIQNNIEMLSTSPPIPKNPIPFNDETDVPIDKISLNWDCEPLQNDVYLGTTNPPPLVAENLSQTWYDPPLLDADTKYYWQVVAKDYAGSETPGPIWNFTTGSRINRPPNPPDMSAEKIGENIFIIRIKITDPDGDDLDWYAVRWDTIHFVFMYDGPFPNGYVVEEMMGYSEGRHELKAQCADRWWQWSEWAYLYIQVSRDKVQSTLQSTNPLFVQNLQQLMNTR
jgi:hypothetical protein